MIRVAPAWLSGYASMILLGILLVNLGTQLGRNAYGLTLPSMRDSLELSHFQEGSLITALSILSMTGSFVFGMLAPRYGTRFIVGVSSICLGVAMIFLGSSTSFMFALAMSALVGFATEGCTTPVMGLLSVWFASKNRGTIAGLAASGGGVSFIVIGAIVPWLTGRDAEDGWRHSWYGLAVIVIAIGVFSLLFLRDRPGQSAETVRPTRVWPIVAYKSRAIWLIAFLAFCTGWSVALYTTFFGEYLQDEGFSVDTAGRLWGLFGLLGIFSPILWGSMSDRLGRRSGFLLSFIVFGTGCLVLWLIPVVAGIVAAVVLLGLTFRAAFTICAASAGDYVEPQFSAAAWGLMGVGAALGHSISPIIAGRLADATDDLGLVFALAAAGTAVGVFGSVFLRRA